MSALERKITWEPAYDKRNPDPHKNYGIHGMTLRFFVKGPLGAIQFVVYTNWHLKHVQGELDMRMDSQFPHLSCHPMPADLGYHSPVPIYEGQTKMSEKCEILGGACFYDGSTLNAEPVYWLFVEKGEDALWKELEDYYHSIFTKVEA